MPRYQFAFPVYNATLDDDLPEFKVADVSFVNKSNLPNDYLSSREELLKLHKNHILAVVEVCESEKNAKDAAFDRCCFAADIFKICTDLFHSNNFNPKKWQFDINTGFVTQGQSFFFFKELGSNNSDSLRLTLNRNRFVASINTKLWESRNKWNIKDFESLYQAVYSPGAKSIHKVLKRACRLYSHSFSIDNLYERTVLLCAVLDTLATCERNGKISQLKKHLPRLVLKCEKLSKNLKSFIEQVYDIRSAYVHNAEESGLTEKDVDYLEKIVYRVILQIIRNSKNYTSIKELCVAIEKDKFVPIKDNLPDIYVPPCISSRKNRQPISQPLCPNSTPIVLLFLLLVAFDFLAFQLAETFVVLPHCVRVVLFLLGIIVFQVLQIKGCKHITLMRVAVRQRDTTLL